MHYHPHHPRRFAVELRVDAKLVVAFGASRVGDLSESTRDWLSPQLHTRQSGTALARVVGFEDDIERPGSDVGVSPYRDQEILNRLIYQDRIGRAFMCLAGQDAAAPGDADRRRTAGYSTDDRGHSSLIRGMFRAYPSAG